MVSACLSSIFVMFVTAYYQFTSARGSPLKSDVKKSSMNVHWQVQCNRTLRAFERAAQCALFVGCCCLCNASNMCTIYSVSTALFLPPLPEQ